MRLFPYVDTVGKITIGVGHNLTDNGLPSDLVDALEGLDLNDVIAGLDEALPWWQSLDGPRQQVLGNMAFQLGVHGLLGFDQTLFHVERREFDAAADQMLQSKWARQVWARANRLSRQMRSGQPSLA